MTGQSRVALFIDYENIFFGLHNQGAYADPRKIVQAAQKYGTVVHARAFADFKDPTLEKEIPNLRSATIEVQHVPNAATRGKIRSYVDFALLDDVYQSVLDRPEIDTYVLATGDGHFAGVVARLRFRLEKKVVVMGARGTISRELRQSAMAIEELDLPAPVDERDLLMFMLEGESKYSYISFGSTAKAYASHKGIPEVSVQAVLSALVTRGAVRQEVARVGEREVRVLRVPIPDQEDAVKATPGQGADSETTSQERGFPRR
jgi:uncharacterized LabA/DUF88 family protein